jgi:hypothetical protein
MKLLYIRQDVSGTSNPTNRRQKTWDLLDQTALTQAKQQKQQSAQVQIMQLYLLFAK